ncbi:MAG: glycosyltransferase family 2 protein [Actinomycetota bacterium]|nr:glycosyltransferase family 2 protein [Actinomycetota bacterium]
MSVVIPVLNEARNLPWVLGRMPADLHEVILVDGRSVDGTVDIARSILPDIVVVTEARRGKGRALRAGFAAATGDVIVMLDGDGSMDPVEISRFVALLRHHDFVKGSRCLVEGDSDDFTWVRRLGNRSLLALVNSLFGQPFTDLCYGYCAFRRAHLERLDLTADGFEIETQLVVHAIKAGLRIVEVPSVELVRMEGISNLRVARDGRRVLRTILRERLSWFEAPLAATAPTGADISDTRSGAATSRRGALRNRVRTSGGSNGHQHGHESPSTQPALGERSLASSQ